MSYRVKDSDARTEVLVMTERRRKTLRWITAMRPYRRKALRWMTTVRPYLVHTRTSNLRIAPVVVPGAARLVHNDGTKRMALVTSVRSLIYLMQKKHCGTYHNGVYVYAFRVLNIPSHVRYVLSTW